MALADDRRRIAGTDDDDHRGCRAGRISRRGAVDRRVPPGRAGGRSLAGILFGLATYKPQMGILVPVALVAAGLWRTIAAAVLHGVAVLVVVTSHRSSAPGIWSAWVANVVRLFASVRR